MLKLMDKKIFTILPSKSVFIFTYDYLPMIITKKKLNQQNSDVAPHPKGSPRISSRAQN